MATYPYTGRLSDFGEAPIADAAPKLWVEPSRSAFGAGGGVLAESRKPISMNSFGEFTTWLVPSVETTPATLYTLRCEWRRSDAEGNEVMAGLSEWVFIAALGGGAISEMAAIPITRIWAGDTPPTRPGPGLWWFDTSSYPYKWKEWVD